MWLLCASTDNAPELCTLLGDGIVEHRQTQLCKTVCISKNPIRMLSRLIQTIITSASQYVHHAHHEIAPNEAMVRVTLQRDDAVAPARSSQPFLFDADCFNDTLDLELLTSPDNPAPRIQNPYRIGVDTLDLTQYIGPNTRGRLNRDVLSALHDADGDAVSLCLSLPDLGRTTNDVALGGIEFKHAAIPTWWRARPVYLFAVSYTHLTLPTKRIV